MQAENSLAHGAFVAALLLRQTPSDSRRAAQRGGPPA